MTTFFPNNVFLYEPSTSAMSHLSGSSPPTSSRKTAQSGGFTIPTSSSRQLKRQMSSEDEDDYQALTPPSAKRPHYEDRISTSFDGIRIDSPNNSPASDAQGFEEIDDVDFPDIDDVIDDEEEPVVEEPEEAISLSDELKRYLDRLKSEPLIPYQPQGGNELVLYSPASDMSQRISEVVDRDEEIVDLSEQEMAGVSENPTLNPLVEDDLMDID